MKVKVFLKQWLWPFILIFIAVLLFINWQRIVLFTNYRVLFNEIKETLRFTPSPARQARDLAVQKLIEQSAAPQVKTANQQTLNGIISLPKINIQSPIVFPNVNNPDFKALLANGAVHFPGSALPGQPGATIILGHSAPPGWPKVKYDWIFSDLYKLSEGDEVSIFLNGQQYIYRVQQKFFVDKGAEVPIPLTNNKSMLILLSCWPPGKDLYRIAVEAILD